jgi:hypothetical protein
VEADGVQRRDDAYDDLPRMVLRRPLAAVFKMRLPLDGAGLPTLETVSISSGSWMTQLLIDSTGRCPRKNVVAGSRMAGC